VVIGRTGNIPMSASWPGQNGNHGRNPKALAFLASVEGSYLTRIELCVDVGEGQILRSGRPFADWKAKQPSSRALPHGTVWK